MNEPNLWMLLPNARDAHSLFRLVLILLVALPLVVRLARSVRHWTPRTKLRVAVVAGVLVLLLVLSATSPR
jgi:hypothetical protein